MNPSSDRGLAPARRPGLPRRLLTFPGREVHAFEALPSLLAPGDLLVVNDAATLPASLSGSSAAGDPVEVRLTGERGDGAWETVAFGAGDWRVDTDLRPPPAIRRGDVLRFGPGFSAVVVELAHPRRPVLVFSAAGAEFWRLLYRFGRPIQYRHLDAALDIWDVQTGYAGRPWAVEAPSAGLGLTLGLFSALRSRGVAVASITEAAGISATGDADLDATLPFPERYAVPAATWAAVEARQGRLVAVGTSVVRALETVARTGALSGVTSLRLSADEPVRVVDGLISGVHAPETSHYQLVDALLAGTGLGGWPEMSADAARFGLRDHEFGDVVLLLACFT